MRSWRYLLLALASGGGLAPLGLALTLPRVRAVRVLLACSGGLVLFALVLWQPYHKSLHRQKSSGWQAG